MNSETGQIYRGSIEIEAAKRRGEPVVPVSDHVARTMEAGHRVMNRKQRRAQEREQRIAANKAKARQVRNEEKRKA